MNGFLDALSTQSSVSHTHQSTTHTHTQTVHSDIRKRAFGLLRTETNERTKTKRDE